MNTVATLQRPVQTKKVSLNTPSGVWRFPVSSGKAATIAARLADGAWGAGALTVKYWAGDAGPFDFASGAKTIAAGGGSAVASLADMAGVSEIEVAWLATAVTGIVDLMVTTDTDVVVVQSVPLTAGPGGGTGTPDSPDGGGDTGSGGGVIT